MCFVCLRRSSCVKLHVCVRVNKEKKIRSTEWMFWYTSSSDSKHSEASEAASDLCRLFASLTISFLRYRVSPKKRILIIMRPYSQASFRNLIYFQCKCPGPPGIIFVWPPSHVDTLNCPRFLCWIFFRLCCLFPLKRKDLSFWPSTFGRLVLPDQEMLRTLYSPRNNNLPRCTRIEGDTSCTRAA